MNDLYEAILPKKNHLRVNIIAIDAIAIVFFLLFVGIIYLINIGRFKTTSLISPVQKATQDTSINKSSKRLNITNKEVIGFLPSWEVSQNAKINVKVMSQIIYFGLGVNKNGDLVEYNEEQNPTLEWHYFNSEYFNGIRKDAKDNKIKVLIAFKMFENKSIDDLISNSLYTDRFIKNVVSVIKKYNLDGVNLDFEYFTDSDFPTVKYLNTFLQNVSVALKGVNPAYILSIDINATALFSDKAYDMVKIGEVVDEVIVMAYDYKTSLSTIAGPVAPLDANENEHSIKKTISSLAGRVPSYKIILGIPFYGYEWQTLNEKFKSPTIDGSGALASYKRVRELIDNRSDLKTHWDEISLSPWLSYRQSGAIKQIYYEDEKSILAKMEFIKSKNLGGIAVWAVGYEGKYDDIWNVIVDNK